MRFPLPLVEMRAALMASSRPVMRAVIAAGVDRDDMWSLVWLGFSRRPPYDPGKMRSPAAWVQAVGRCILLDVLRDATRKKQLMHRDTLPANDEIDGCADDGAWLVDLAADVGVSVDVLVALQSGWTVEEAASVIGVRSDVLRRRVARVTGRNP